MGRAPAGAQGTCPGLRTRKVACAFLRLSNRVPGFLLLTLLCFAVGAAASACAGSGAAVHERAILIVSGLPSDARLLVDERVWPVSLASAEGITLSAGQRRVEVHADGFLPWQEDVQIVGGAVQELRIELWPQFEEVDRGLPSQRSNVSPSPAPLPRQPGAVIE